MTVHLLKNTFSRGEFSPKAQSRADLEQYAGGAELVRNFISAPHGGLRRRSGTKFAGRAKFNNKQTASIEFVYSSTGDALIVEFGHHYIRFWQMGAQLVNGDGSPYELVSTYDHTDVEQIQYVQVGNVIYLAHSNYAPATLTRLDDGTWALSTITFVDGPWLPINDTTTACSLSSGSLTEGTTTTVNFTNSAEGVNGGAGFSQADVGRQIRIKGNGAPSLWTYGVITSVTDIDTIGVQWKRVGTGVTKEDDVTNGGTVASNTKSWRLGAFSGTTGWPACVEVFESRLTWANTPTDQRTLFFSRTGIPLDYSPSNGDATVTADHGFSLSILAGRTDEILWLQEAPRLQVGTPSGIRTIGGSDTSQALSPTNVSQKLEVSYGVSLVPPAKAGDSSVVAARFGRQIRRVYYDYQSNSLVAADMSRLHDHLLAGIVKRIVYQQVPEGILWVLFEDGTLIGVTYDQQERIVAFHKHDFGGNDTMVVDIAVIPGSSRDELWLTTDRFIGGQFVRYFEVMEPDFDVDTDELENAFFVDCGATYVGPATNTVSGLTHLANEQVVALCDGVVVRDLTISAGGVLTLPDARTAEVISVGYGITSEFRTLRPPYQQNDGWVLGRNQKVVNVLIEVLKTGGLEIGSRNSSTQPIEHRRGDTPFGLPTPLKHGKYHVNINDRWEDGGQVYGIVEDPLPAFVRSLLVKLDTEQG